MTFTRKFVPLENIEIYKPQEIVDSPEYDWSKCAHALQPDGTFIVNEKVDGKTTENHIEGIEYIKGVLLKGNKILPPLVQSLGKGKYRKMDGFKRLVAYKQLGYKNVEVFVCKKWKEESGGMVCRGGGQHYTKFPKLLEGDEGIRPRDTILARGARGLRLEFRESYHIHVGDKGWVRLVMGKRDFLLLAEAFEQWEL